MPTEKKYKQKSPPWERNLLLTVLAFALIIVLLWRLFPGLVHSSSGDFSSVFGRSLVGSEYLFIGDMRTQVYYPAASEKAKAIPENQKVRFKDEPTAQKYGFTRGHENR
jgi:hypothetical protein